MLKKTKGDDAEADGAGEGGKEDGILHEVFSGPPEVKMLDYPIMQDEVS